MINITVLILLIISLISLFCSSTTLWLIYQIKKYTGYHQIIYHLTLCQIIYDISCVMVSFGESNINKVIYIGFRTFGGIATSLWTNLVSYVVFYTIYNCKVFDISMNFKLLVSIVLLPSIPLMIFTSLSFVNNTSDDTNFIEILNLSYAIIRIISISINIFIYIYLSYYFYQRDRGVAKEDVNKDSVRNLVNQIKYYPIIQVVSRIMVFWYEFYYNHNYKYNSNYSLLQKISLILYVISLPSAGIGYFLIFINVSPGAITFLKSKLFSIEEINENTKNKNDKIMNTLNKQLIDDYDDEYSNCNNNYSINNSINTEDLEIKNINNYYDDDYDKSSHFISNSMSVSSHIN